MTSIRSLKTQLTAADINPRKTDFWFPECQNDPAEDKTWYDRPNNSSTQSSTGMISCENRKYPITIAKKSLTEAQEAFPRSRTGALARPNWSGSRRALALPCWRHHKYLFQHAAAWRAPAVCTSMRITDDNLQCLFIYLCMYTQYTHFLAITIFYNNYKMTFIFIKTKYYRDRPK